MKRHFLDSNPDLLSLAEESNDEAQRSSQMLGYCLLIGALITGALVLFAVSP